jgi:hypothetical protein
MKISMCKKLVNSGQNIQAYNSIILRNGTGPAPYMIGIAAKFDQDPGIGAGTGLVPKMILHEITSGSIVLYAGWLRGSERYKANSYSS